MLDLVERYTEPGRLRDRLLRHWFRGKILKRLTGKKFLGYPDEYRGRLIDVVGPLAQRRFGPGVDGGLSFPNRIRAALLRADRRADLVTFAQFEVDLSCRAVVTSARWSRGGGLYLTVDVSITRDGDDALVFEPGTRALTSLPVAMDGLPTGLLEAGRELQNDRVELVWRDKAAGLERRVANLHPKSLNSLRIAIDPLKVFRPDDEARGAKLFVTVRRAGWTFDVPLTADAATLAAAGRSPLLAGRTCTPVAGRGGAVETAQAVARWPTQGSGRARSASGAKRIAQEVTGCRVSAAA